MTIEDMAILQREHDAAVAEATSAATAIAELVSAGEQVTDQDLARYRTARLGVESTSRDLDYCLKLELHEIMAEV